MAQTQTELFAKSISLHASKAALYEQQNTLNTKAREAMILKVEKSLESLSVGPKVFSVGKSGDFASIQAGVNYLQNKLITGNVILQVLDGEYEHNRVNISNLLAKVKILGNLEAPEKCRIVWTPNSGKQSDGFCIAGSSIELGGFHTFGGNGADNVTARHIRADSGSGVLVHSESFIASGGRAAVEVYAGSVLSAHKFRADNVQHGGLVGSGSAANFNRAVISGQGEDVGNGIYVSDGGSATADFAEVSNNYIGFRTTTAGRLAACSSKAESKICLHSSGPGSAIIAARFSANYDPSVLNALTHGATAQHSAFISMEGAVVDSGYIGVEAYANSEVMASSSVVTASRCFVSHYSSYLEVLQTADKGAVIEGGDYKYSASTSRAVENVGSVIRWS